MAVGYSSTFTPLAYVTKAGVTACSAMSVKNFPAFFVHLFVISHLLKSWEGTLMLILTEKMA